MARDRLNELQGSRYQRDHDYEMREPSRPGGGGPDLEAAGADENDFLQQVDATQHLIDSIRASIASIDNLHARSLVALSADDTARNSRMVDALQDETNRLLQQARANVKSMAAATKHSRGSEANIRRAQQSQLAKKLMACVQEYQGVQEAFKKKWQLRMEREYRIARPNATTAEVQNAIEHADGPIFAQQVLTTRIGEQRRALEEVQNRHVELQRIEQSIEQLFNLFQDMQILLDTQQEQITQIDQHVDNTVAYVEDGGKEMQKAVVHRRNTRKRAWCLCVALIILIVVIAFLIWWFGFGHPGVKFSTSNTV
ncbi:hypothetical protein SeMB42_g07247 [Synchytrium endobioticum]|uniref:t-SNARE coiled-coil homology domain-containing protein n=1 Tax=Synchytrium endobioticum TaxID=286115 RepID=A0A507C753_9FUNG|nr:hypothetical protein SeMB42_g07247 [Synchytrium endobioticum]TPX46158.1 hypothetical protein SeLEV6574_g03381 [Synchytrium endobioticum]